MDDCTLKASYVCRISIAVRSARRASRMLLDRLFCMTFILPRDGMVVSVHINGSAPTDGSRTMYEGPGAAWFLLRQGGLINCRL